VTDRTAPDSTGASIGSSNGRDDEPSGVPPVVVIGASAGGVTALERLVAGLPPDLPAAVLVVLHLNPSGVSLLPEILGRAGSLPTAHATDGEPLRAGTVRVASPDRHLHVADGHIVVDRGPHEHGHRPAIDKLFRSAAASHGRAAVGVLLSGMLDDGVWGLDEIRRAGGTTIVQDPADAQFPALPSAAIDAGVAELVVDMGEMAQAIDRAVRSAETREHTSQPLDDPPDEPIEPHTFSCPACGGAMQRHAEWRDGEMYRCHTGHLYSSATLSVAQVAKVDEAMWAALRSLHEQAALSRRIARRLDPSSTRRNRQLRRAEIAERRADVLHEFLTVAGGSEDAETDDVVEVGDVEAS
jgi:two-component system, chemotaxis family, protein-glutamate methylesterase/glutaminase